MPPSAPLTHGRDLPERYARFNIDHARLRAPGERASARLKQGWILRKARCGTKCERASRARMFLTHASFMLSVRPSLSGPGGMEAGGSAPPR